jgi:hypothetical protein
MTATPESTRARRYLLGDASDEECAVLEQEYLGDDEAVDRIAAAEDDLIEEYLANQLGPAERERFERVYLASPHHRVRVETIRRLMALGSQAKAQAPIPFPVVWAQRVRRPVQLFALAASLILVASIGLVVYSMRERQRTDVAQNQPTQPSSPAPGAETTPPSDKPPIAPRVFALTLSPVSVRGESEPRPAIVPAGTDTMMIRLEADAASRGTFTPTRASIRTIVGAEIWQGPVAPEPNGPRSVIGRLDVPAARVPADDYLITLYGTNPAGKEQEWAQYFLRLRKE